MNNNNFIVPIPKELKKIQSKLFFGLTKRQLIGFGSAIALGALVFFLLKGITNTDIAMFAMFFVSAPIFFGTIYTKDGLPTEKWLKLLIEYKYINPQKRRFRITTTNENLAKQRGIRIGKRKRTKKKQPNTSATKSN